MNGLYFFDGSLRLQKVAEVSPACVKMLDRTEQSSRAAQATYNGISAGDVGRRLGTGRLASGGIRVRKMKGERKTRKQGELLL